MYKVVQYEMGSCVSKITDEWGDLVLTHVYKQQCFYTSALGRLSASRPAARAVVPRATARGRCTPAERGPL